MQSFNWGEMYETGLQDVDHQHHNLVDTINQLGALLLEGNIPRNELEKLVNKLASYASYHFKEEEQMMARKGIDSRHLSTHVGIHKRFLNEVGTLVSDLPDNCTRQAKQLFEFLVHWLSYHILGSDQDMARQLACIENGMSAQEAYDQEERDKNPSTKPLLEALTGLFELVSRRNKELLELNLSLEYKVKQRTEELQIVNQHLEEISLTDSLTKLPNRRHAMRSMNQLWEIADQSGMLMSCIMIDADYFKEINDKYGHDAGDKVLIELAQTLNEAIRTDDTVCRLGGDEFLVICPNTDKNGVKKVAENLLNQVSNLHVNVNEGAWHGSVSIGVATKNSETTCCETLLKIADNNLYAAKRGGRSCIKYSSK